jgi:hypothetical protein
VVARRKRRAVAKRIKRERPGGQCLDAVETVCPACANPVGNRVDRCPACRTVITGMANGHVDQTAADYGADQVDATVSGPGDTDGGAPWAPDEAA